MYDLTAEKLECQPQQPLQPWKPLTELETVQGENGDPGSQDGCSMTELNLCNVKLLRFGGLLVPNCSSIIDQTTTADQQLCYLKSSVSSGIESY